MTTRNLIKGFGVAVAVLLVAIVGIPMTNTPCSASGLEWMLLDDGVTSGSPGWEHAQGVYDFSRDRLVFYGGIHNSARQGDVWSWDFQSSTWEQLAGVAAPGVRQLAGAIYDPTADALLFHGGEFDGVGPDDDTWAFSFSTNTWTELTTSNQVTRGSHGALYDPVGHQMVVFGGSSYTHTFYGDVRALPLSGPGPYAWQVLHDGSGGGVPEPRRYVVAGYDAPRHRMIIFGGESATLDKLGDLWSFSLDTNSWTLLDSGGGAAPDPRYRYFGAVDSGRETYILYGGTGDSGHLGDTWEWDLVAGGWTLVDDGSGGGNPGARAQGPSIYRSSGGGQFVVYGGRDAGGEKKDLWAMEQALFDIDGYVYDSEGSPVEGATITKIGGAGGWTTTDATGYYLVGNNIAGLDYELVPSMPGCRFIPESRTYDDLGQDWHEQNFTAICGEMVCNEFDEDPALLTYINPENSESHYYHLDCPVLPEVGEGFVIGFAVDDYNFQSFGHSSVLGPRSQTPDDFPDLRFNIHFDQNPGQPQISLSAPGSSGIREPIDIGTSYVALVTNGGGTADLSLIDAQTGTIVFTDSVTWDWVEFDAFQLGYDYYGGGYCTWDGVGEVDFLSDRNVSFVEGSIDYVCLPDCATYDIDGYVYDTLGSPVEGVTITKTGGDGGWTTTDATGYYLVGNNIAGLNYVLTPSMAGCAFDPPSRIYDDLDQDWHDQNFTADCGDLVCDEFEVDPDIITYSSPEASESHYYHLDCPVSVDLGEGFKIGFIIDDYNFQSFGHSSVLGPRSQTPDDFPDLRFNIHFDQNPGQPQISLSAPGSPGARFPINTESDYEAIVTNGGGTAELNLIEVGVGTVFTDSVTWDWVEFDAFQLGYDYYGGGYCTWDGVGEVDFLSDRNVSFVEGSIDYVCLPDCATYDIDGYVYDTLGSPVEGVTITKTGGDGGWTTTDATGYYLVGNNIAGLNYVLTPSMAGCAFDPPSRIYDDLDQDWHDQNFTADCGDLVCDEFEVDPDIITYSSPEASESHYYHLDCPVSVDLGEGFKIGFIIDDYNFQSFGHSSVLGPRSQTPDDFPDLRFNIHFDQNPGQPQISLSAPGSPGIREPIDIGTSYVALVTNGGGTADLSLIDAQTGTIVFTDSVTWDWVEFDAFQLGYDYYGGGYCTWDGVGEVDFLSDRNVSFVEGSIDYVCLPDCATYDIDGYVYDTLGSPVEGVTITKTGGDGGWTTTDATGYYLVGNNIAGLNYVLTPSMAGCAFDPPSRIYDDLDQDWHDQNFTALCGVDTCYEFDEDPGLIHVPNVDGSISSFFLLDNPTLIGAGGSFEVLLRVDDFNFESFGHSSVLGPRSSAPEDFPELRLNIHYDQDAGSPEFSLSSPGTPGTRVPISVGTDYRAVVSNGVGSAVLRLYEDATGALVDSYSVPWSWPAFEAFQLCYDYYGGGYCQWDGVGAVDFRSDRNVSFVEGSIDHVCFDGDGLYDIDGYVFDALGYPVEGIVVNKTGGAGGWTTTDENGYYLVGNNTAGLDYTLTPTAAGCVFFPIERTYTNLDRNFHAQNYIMNCDEDICFGFGVDPDLQHCSNGDGSISSFIRWGSLLHICDQGGFSVTFTLDAGNSASGGHSSVMGPRLSDCDDFPQLRLNLHYDEAGGPYFSLSSPGVHGTRFAIAPGDYQAVVTNHGFLEAEVSLYDNQTREIVFVDSVPWGWPGFDAFQLCYDYYGGGYCNWNGVDGVDFRSDRSVYYVEGTVDALCFIDECTAATAPAPGDLPTELSLNRIWQPSPTEDSRFAYSVPSDGTVNLEIFDVLGRQITTLARGPHRAGEYDVRWDGSRSGGQRVGAGIYFAVLRSEHSRVAGKFLRW